jgi:diguanylate cyclase (GGDEF)-like protein/PAS domain S-box-containing protein
METQSPNLPHSSKSDGFAAPVVPAGVAPAPATQNPTEQTYPLTNQSPANELTPFHHCLLDNMRDGAIYVDQRGHILDWSQAVEIMTGMSRSNVQGMVMNPGLLSLSDSNGVVVEMASCPIQECLRTGKKKAGEYKIAGRSGRETKVEMTFAPVVSNDGTIRGAIVLVHDTSVQLDLKRQLKDLYEFSMLDPLTQVANRAEFERVLDEYVRAKHNSDFRCSIIICDIDFFKSINDNYNHHIGDQALVSFAGLLKKFVRAQDVVARYGGEEFVILCADCDIDSAVQRAEEIRVLLTKTPQQMLDGKCITASFGVAELKKSDSATEFFVRADTALLKAKELGRNQVVEASQGNNGEGPELKSAEATSLAGVKWRNIKGQSLICEEFSTATPMAVLVEKLRGLIIESEAEIRRVEPDFATMLIQVEDEDNHSRKGNFVLDIEFQEREAEEDESGFVGKRTKTFIRVTIREGKKKWFAANATELAPNLLSDIRRYLMIQDEASRLKVTPAATSSGR